MADKQASSCKWCVTGAHDLLYFSSFYFRRNSSRDSTTALTMRKSGDALVVEQEAPLLINDVSVVQATPKWPWLSSRRVLVLYCFLGTMAGYMMRMNLSVAIVSMVNQTFALQNSGKTSNSECRHDTGNRSSATPKVWMHQMSSVVV